MTAHHVSLEAGDNWHRMGDLVRTWVIGVETPDCIGLEDFVFRAPKVTGQRLIPHAVAMGKLVGYLYAELREIAPVILVPPSEAQRGAVYGKAARAAGIPGGNKHEYAAWYIREWLKRTMRVGRTA